MLSGDKFVKRIRMTKATQKKLKKLEDLKRLLSENPYMNDNQLAVTLGVSVPCIRNYRNELGIK